MDEELKELAGLALRNAFWYDFSALVNSYLEAAEGLNVAEQEMCMGELTSIYGRNTEAKAKGIGCRIETHKDYRHKTILEALEYRPATEVWLSGTKVFERRDGEWYFTGDE